MMEESDPNDPFDVGIELLAVGVFVIIAIIFSPLWGPVWLLGKIAIMMRKSDG